MSDLTTLQRIIAKEGEEILIKLYLSGVGDKLRTVHSPSNGYDQRWIWELMQNAVDTLHSDPNRDSVDIEVDVDECRVIFRHNGPPFDPHSLILTPCWRWCTSTVMANRIVIQRVDLALDL